jgi:membrane-associated phospholipid phosphatase
MRTKEVVWMGLLALAVFLTICLKYFPHLPGDVGITRFAQSALPESTRWAQLLSATAAAPWIFVVLGVTFVLSWMIAGPRAGLLSIVAFVGLWLLGKLLGPAISQPRPSPELVRAAGTLAGSAFPSLFAFNYISTVGFVAVLAAVKTSGRLRFAVVTVCSLLLFVGCVARVALAAHWPSDVAISYLIGLLWVTLLIRFV